MRLKLIQPLLRTELKMSENKFYCNKRDNAEYWEYNGGDPCTHCNATMDKCPCWDEDNDHR